MRLDHGLSSNDAPTYNYTIFRYPQYRIAIAVAHQSVESSPRIPANRPTTRETFKRRVTILHYITAAVYERALELNLSKSKILSVHRIESRIIGIVPWRMAYKERNVMVRSEVRFSS